ncbi:alpha/beta hydrolase family protein [Sphingomonas sp. MMS24-JH45]
MILWVHGGPWARDNYGYSYHQWLAEPRLCGAERQLSRLDRLREEFVQAGDRRGRKMHDDLLDAVDWAVKRGVTAKDTAAIGGGSYGGYADARGL